MSNALVTAIAAELARPVPAGAGALTERLRARYGPALRAVLMYGSNLRKADDQEGVLDLYALVSSYDEAFRGQRFLATANRWLPPNVFYLETGSEPRIVRCKYAVLTLDDLRRGTGPATAEPYFWARFAQPCALVWAADAEVQTTVAAALGTAVTTFVRFAVPFAPVEFDARTLWTTGWRTTYGGEVRPERPGAAATFFEVDAERFERLTTLALADLPWPASTVTAPAPRHRVDVPVAERARLVRAWRVQRVRSKVLFLLRMLRNGLIFEGGVDYVLWKIQRHSGIPTDRSWREKRHPWLALGAEAWRLYRARAFR